MVRSNSSIKAVVLLVAAVSAVSASDALAPQKSALRDVDMAASFEVDVASHGRKLYSGGFSWTWSKLLFATNYCGCGPKEGPLKILNCADMCKPRGPIGPGPRLMDECNCDMCNYAEDYDTCVEEGGYETEDGGWISNNSGSSTSDAGTSKSTGGAAMSSNWWMYAVGAATVGLIGGAIVMRKRRNAAAEDELNPDASISGAVSKRAALLAGGGGGGAAAGASLSMPKFLSVPGFRRAPSGLEVGPDGAIIEQSPSSYMDMDNQVDPSQLPEGVEVSDSGNLEPYHGGSMA